MQSAECRMQNAEQDGVRYPTCPAPGQRALAVAAVKSQIRIQNSRIASLLLPFLLLATSSLFAADAPAEVPFAEPDAPEMMKATALSGNLIPNSSFEAGKYWPAQWEPADKLGTLWGDGGTDGKRCLRMDTNIDDTQWVEWNKKVLKLGEEAVTIGKGDPQALPADPIPSPSAKLPTNPPYYDTVGGIHGVHYRSDFIKLEPGAIYRFTVDARTTANGGEPKVFIKGFFDERARTEQGEMVIKRDAGNAMLTLVKCNENWQRWVCIFHPARWKSTINYQPLQAQWLRVDLYSYWPVGTYEFDNARLEIIGSEEIANPPIPPAPKPKTPEKPETAPADSDDEFPVIP